MLESYPDVADEFATIAQLAKGYSIARFGDGELKLIYNSGYAREPSNSKLRMELYHVLNSPHARCLAGVWPLRGQQGPKYESLMRHEPRFLGVLSGRVSYVSSMITRPDCAPWIHTKEFAESVESLWRGRKAVVVCEKHGSIYKTVHLRAGLTQHVQCPHREAYAQIDLLMAEVLALAPEVVVLSAGPTATCLANRLAGHGIQALDLGSSGRWLGRLLA